MLLPIRVCCSSMHAYVKGMCAPWCRQARDDLQALKLEEAALQAGSAKPVAGVSQEQQDVFL